MDYTPKELSLKSIRNRFYSEVRTCTIPGIIWCPEKESYGNHMDFRINGIHGHVNWYFRFQEVHKYQGNVCVVFKYNPIESQIPAGFRVHPVHGDWIIASADIDEVPEALEWTVRIFKSTFEYADSF